MFCSGETEAIQYRVLLQFPVRAGRAERGAPGAVDERLQVRGRRGRGRCQTAARRHPAQRGPYAEVQRGLNAESCFCAKTIALDGG